MRCQEMGKEEGPSGVAVGRGARRREGEEVAEHGRIVGRRRTPKGVPGDSESTLVETEKWR